MFQNLSGTQNTKYIQSINTSIPFDTVTVFQVYPKERN